MKLSWQCLEALIEELDMELATGKLTNLQYVWGWDATMTFAGWTWNEFVEEVDKHWTPQKKFASPLFRC
jgi:hypothetical protein